MDFSLLPDIPRIFTALAEFLACLVYVIPAKKRFGGYRLVILLVAGLALQSIVQLVAGLLPIVFWIPGMVAAVGVMFFFVYACCDIKLTDATYLCMRAFILAEFTAALFWQIYCMMIWNGVQHCNLILIATLIIVYGGIFASIYFFDTRTMARHMFVSMSSRENVSALIIVVGVFIMNNINFILIDTQSLYSIRESILYIRTLMDFAGLIMLYAHQAHRKEIYLRVELKAMDNLLRRQHDQFELSKDVIQTISYKHHDLKHQIAVIRAEKNHDKRESYLAEMDRAISLYEAQNKTGNYALDIVLTSKSLVCAEGGITFSCVADGKLLNFMEVIDICTIFGNMLENAIESVGKLEEISKRVINLALFKQNEFIMIRMENYSEEALEFEDGLPTTTKQDAMNHGYGIKSIKRSVEKYDGNLTIHLDDNWFVLRILIPIQ